MVDLLFGVLFLVVFLGLGYWLLTLLPIPEPFATIIKVVAVLICLVVLYQLYVGTWPTYTHHLR